MTRKEWVEEIFPDIYIIGHEASDTQGEQAILIDKHGHTYLIFTEGFDYGSWVGIRYELTQEGRKLVIDWKGDTYDLKKTLDEMAAVLTYSVK